MKTWDVIVVGGGVIGLALSIELRKTGRSVLLVERGEPGREASYAAGGMLANQGDEIPKPLQPLANASADMFPEWVHELHDESGLAIDFREYGTILFPAHALVLQKPDSEWKTLIPAKLRELEPALAALNRPAVLLNEKCVDPRTLLPACIKAARHREVDFSSGDPAVSITVSSGAVTGVKTTKTSFSSATVINCAGAWAGEISPVPIPVRPVKGQMLAVTMPSKDLLKHVVRSPNVYLIPRSNGLLAIGATLEEAGFDKQTVPETIKRLHQSALDLLPDLGNGRILEAWAGLRPGTPDSLPILGPTGIAGYYVATGHYRDGILLAPATAKIMTQLISGSRPDFDLDHFSLLRFGGKAA